MVPDTQDTTAARQESQARVEDTITMVIKSSHHFQFMCFELDIYHLFSLYFIVMVQHFAEKVKKEKRKKGKKEGELKIKNKK